LKLVKQFFRREVPFKTTRKTEVRLRRILHTKNH